MKKKKGKKKRSKVYKVVQVILLAVVIVCVWNIGSYLKQRHDSKEEFSAIQKTVKEISLPDKNKKDGKNKLSYKEIMEALLSKNGDSVAWLSVEGTENEYPVVQTPGDNNYYLRRGFNKSYNIAGVPFLDKDNKADFTDQNSVIYGHMMYYDDTMFGVFRNYFDQEYVDNSPKTIKLATKNGVYTYRIFSIHTLPAEAKYRIPNMDPDAFVKFMETTQADSAANFHYDKGFHKDDRILTLSTCPPNGDKSKRVAVVGILEDIEK